MRIVINAYSARQGGGQTYIRNLLSHLPVDPALDVVVFAPLSLSLPSHPQIRRVAARWPTTNPLTRTLWEKWALPGYLRQVDADVLFCPGGVVATNVPAGCKSVTMFRNMIPFDKKAKASLSWSLQRARSVLLRRVMLRSMRKADLTIFISEFARDVVARLAQIPNSVTIPHGVSDSFRSADAGASAPVSLGAEPYLLYVSKFDSYKHQLEVVQGYAMLPQAILKKIRLVLVGEVDHKSARQVEDFIDRAGLAGRVLIHGPARYEDLPAMYSNAVANVFASSCENCPNILLEALAAGRPVLSSDLPPMPEFGGDGIVYFSPYDPTSITAAMERVLSDDVIARDCGAAALRQSMHYDWSLTAARTWAAIKGLSNQSQRPVANASTSGGGRHERIAGATTSPAINGGS